MVSVPNGAARCAISVHRAGLWADPRGVLLFSDNIDAMCHVEGNVIFWAVNVIGCCSLGRSKNRRKRLTTWSSLVGAVDSRRSACNDSLTQRSVVNVARVPVNVLAAAHTGVQIFAARNFQALRVPWRPLGLGRCGSFDWRPAC